MEMRLFFESFPFYLPFHKVFLAEEKKKKEAFFQQKHEGEGKGAGQLFIAWKSQVANLLPG